MNTNKLGILVISGLLIFPILSYAQQKTAGWIAPSHTAYHPPITHPPAYHPAQGWQNPAHNSWGGSLYVGNGGLVVAGSNGKYGGVIAVGNPNYGYPVGYGGGINWAAVNARNEALCQQAAYSTAGYQVATTYSPGINWAAVNARNEALCQQAAYSSAGYAPAQPVAAGVNWAEVNARNESLVQHASIGVSDYNGHVGVGGGFQTKNLSVGGFFRQ